jgi:hypothetical protein
MKTRNSIAVILILVLIQGSAIRAQESKIINGKITTFGIIPLSNVEITTSKSGNVAYSDFSGSFSISCIEKDIIKVAASGFDAKRIKAKKIDSLNVDLVYSNSQTSFNDAVKNRHISKEILEDAITKYPLKGEKDYSRYSSIYELISTEIYNVNVNGTSITTTKPSSISQSQEVLCAVNGIIYEDISFIVTSDVKSVRYVQGPGASRYGIRGSNGVIEITLR